MNNFMVKKAKKTPQYDSDFLKKWNPEKTAQKLQSEIGAGTDISGFKMFLNRVLKPQK